MRYLLLLCTIALATACQTGSTEQNTSNQKTATDSLRQSEIPQRGHGEIDSLTALIEKKGATAPLLLARARQYWRRQNLAGTERDLAELARLDSNNVGYYELTGEVYYAKNRTREARDAWKRCLQIDPQHSPCIMRMAELMIAIHDFDRALELVDRQIEIDPNDPEAFMAKGIIVRDKSADTSRALKYVQQAIDLRPDYYDAIDLMAVTLTARGDTLARYYYDRLLEMEPDNPDTYYNLGVLYRQTGQINRALEAFTQATQLDEKHHQSYYQLAVINLDLKEYSIAREYFGKAIASKERNYQAYYGRGYTHEVMGDLINARKDYRKALEILSAYHPAQEALARVNRQIEEG